MQDIDFNKIEAELLTFTITEVSKFLLEHKDKIFYAFAFDCNAEYGQVNLCFNTEEDFANTLERYQKGEFGHLYQTDKEIEGLKFNTGDWEYQCFATIHVLTQDELAKIFNSLPEDNYKSWKEFTDRLLVHFCKTLLDFRQTELFHKIPKSKNFKSFCIDHDEDIDEAELRLKQLLCWHQSSL